MNGAMAIILMLIFTVGLVTGVAVLARPLVATVRERLRVDLERRLAEVQLQRVTSEAMLRMLRDERKL